MDVIDCTDVAEATNGFSGAELAALIEDTMFAAFSDGGREITTEDVVLAAKATKPLSVTAGDKIKALRDRLDGVARPASRVVSKTTQVVGRRVD